jgi:hypothetical protein
LLYDRESGKLTEQAEAIVAESLTQLNDGVDSLSTEMGKLLWGNESKKGLGELARENWVKDL